MPRVTIIADPDLIGALVDDVVLPMTERDRVLGTKTESKRLCFELGRVETLIGHIAARVDLIVIARHLVAASRRSRMPKLEIAWPTGRVAVDLAGKSNEEVAALIKATRPFTADTRTHDFGAVPHYFFPKKDAICSGVSFSS